MNIQLTEVPANAAMDTLLAIEDFAGRMYADRRSNESSQRRWNDLASIVLPLREALDEAARR